MRVGLVHDLPVGVDGGGAEAWAMQQLLASAATIGAPPDEFNQRGQDWGLPPWRPQALRAAHYEPFRQTVAAVLRHGGGIRVDHVMGLFRLWWVPQGHSPAEGSYVRYRADELLGVLTLEAHRAGAVVVGEDLGTVEPRVSRELASRGVLGTAVLWFERDGERAKPFRRWRRDALAAVTTHDLPTAAGFLAGEHVRVRAELGQLRRPAAEERAAAEAERRSLVELLVAEGLLDPGADDAAIVRAMHAGLTRTPARLIAANLADAVGDLRQPNLPGTTIEYPNWKLPVAEPDPGEGERPLFLDDLLDHPRVAELARILGEGLAGGSDNVPGDRPTDTLQEPA
jgi:4-alpha-glucanotransferase